MSKYRTLKLKRLDIVDDSGKARISLGTTKAGEPFATLHSPTGNSIQIHALAEGSNQINFWNDQRQMQLTVGLAPNGEAGIAIYTSDGRLVGVVGIDPKHGVFKIREFPRKQGIPPEGNSSAVASDEKKD